MASVVRALVTQQISTMIRVFSGDEKEHHSPSTTMHKASASCSKQHEMRCYSRCSTYYKYRLVVKGSLQF